MISERAINSWVQDLTIDQIKRHVIEQVSHVGIEDILRHYLILRLFRNNLVAKRIHSAELDNDRRDQILERLEKEKASLLKDLTDRYPTKNQVIPYIVGEIRLMASRFDNLNKKQYSDFKGPLSTSYIRWITMLHSPTVPSAPQARGV